MCVGVCVCVCESVCVCVCVRESVCVWGGVPLQGRGVRPPNFLTISYS